MRRTTILLSLFLGTFLTARDTAYTKVLKDVVDHWPPPPVAEPLLDGKAVQLKVYETPGNIDYIGTELMMEVDAPLASVEKVVDEVQHYKDLLPGFEEIKVTEKEANRFDVFWEKIIPVFFVKNIKYTVTYWADKSNPQRLIYKSQLKEQKGLKDLDGLVVLEKRGDKTRYYEAAFFDGDFGVITTLAPKKVWRESVEAVLHGALAKKLKAEKPEMKYDDIMTQVQADVKTYPTEALVNAKKVHPGLSVNPSKEPTT